MSEILDALWKIDINTKPSNEKHKYDAILEKLKSQDSFSEKEYSAIIMIYHDINILEYLLENGADPNHKFDESKSGYLSPALTLLVKSYCSSYSCYMDLQGSGLEDGIEKFRQNLEIISKMINAIVSHGADVNQIDELNGFTALQNATDNNCYDVIKILLECGADIDYCNDKHGNIPPILIAMQHARRSQDLSIVNLLLKNGADINKCDDNGNNALDKYNFVIKDGIKFGNFFPLEIAQEVKSFMKPYETDLFTDSVEDEKKENNNKLWKLFRKKR